MTNLAGRGYALRIDPFQTPPYSLTASSVALRGGRATEPVALARLRGNQCDFVRWLWSRMRVPPR